MSTSVSAARSRTTFSSAPMSAAIAPALCLAGFLHEPSARLDELQARREIERPRGGVRGEFAQRQPGGGRRRGNRPPPRAGPPAWRGRGRKGRAGSWRCSVSSSSGPSKASLDSGRPSTASACGEEGGGGGGVRAEFAAHADGLRALPGKEECDLICHPGLKKNLSFCQRRAIVCRPYAKVRRPPQNQEVRRQTFQNHGHGQNPFRAQLAAATSCKARAPSASASSPSAAWSTRPT